jgi:hypothetical protein
MPSKKIMTLTPFRSFGAGCNGDAPTPTEDDLVADVETLGKMMGFDQQCVRDATSSTRSSANSGSFSARANVLGGLLSSAKTTNTWAKSEASHDANFKERGCGALLMDTKRIAESCRNITCTLTESSNETNVKLKSSARINVDVKADIEDLEVLLMSLERLTVMAAKYPVGSGSAVVTQRSIDSVGAKIENHGTLTISDSVLRAEAGTKLKLMSSNTQQVASTIRVEYEAIVRAGAENHLQQAMGTNAMSPDMRQLLTTEIENSQETIDNTITRSLTSTDVLVSNNGDINITSTGSIDLSNTTLHASSVIDMVLTSVVESAVTLGKDIASKVLADADTQTSMVQESAGQEKAAKVAGQNNTDTIDAEKEGHARIVDANKEDSVMTTIVAGLVAVAVVGAGLAFMSKSSPLTASAAAAAASVAAATATSDVPMGRPVEDLSRTAVKAQPTFGAEFAVRTTFKVGAGLVLLFNLSGLWVLLQPWTWGETLLSVLQNPFSLLPMLLTTPLGRFALALVSLIVYCVAFAGGVDGVRLLPPFAVFSCMLT